MAAEEEEHLKKEINLFGATAYGVGIIIGAGVYALIGPAAGAAGNAVWATFALAALVASFTALSYAKLSSIFPVSDAEYIYVNKAFGKRFYAFIIGWLVILTGILSSAAVSLGFGGYMRAYIDLPEWVMAVGLIALISLINFWGIRQSVRTNILLTLVEVSVIVIIIIFGLSYLVSVDYQ